MTLKVYIVTSLLFLSILACNTAEKKQITQAKQSSEVTLKPLKQKQERFMIKSGSFMGIKPLDKIENHETKFQYGKIRVGEIVKEVLVMEIEGDEIGYAEPDKEDNSLVGSMTFNSSQVSTDKGIQIGSTFREVIEKHPNLIIEKGSNGEKIFVKEGAITFLLDFTAGETEIEISSVPKSALVVEIKISAE